MGLGIRAAIVTITGPNLKEPVVAVTGTFGSFTLPGIPAGHSYIVSVGAKRYAFDQPSRVVNVQDNIAGFDFVSTR